MDNQKIVPIVFATNNNYAPYLYVSVKSLINNVKDNIKYNIYVLYTNLDKRHIKNLVDLTKNNIHVECINVESYMDGINISGVIHLTVEACYRILIPEIFAQYDTVLYIDCDTLILDDVSELYFTSLNNKTIGAMNDVSCTYLKEYYSKHLDMDVCESFNSGVMLIDTKRFVEKKVKDKCMNLLQEDCKADKRKYIYMDQDVLNLVLKNDVCFLDKTWNAQWQYLWRIDTVYPEHQKEYLYAVNNAKILHYAGDKKPWQRPDLDLADKFWEIARNTIYYEEILFSNLTRKTEKNIFSNYIFPFSKLPQNSKIILYGAGEVGKTLYQQNKEIDYVKVILWVDKNNKKLNDKIDTVYSIEDLVSFPADGYDYVLIAINDENICKEIEFDLIHKGISKEKIIWSKYSRL